MNFESHKSFPCPYCGQNNGLSVDLTGGNFQEFVVDCEVCCAPIVLKVKIQGGKILALDVRRENE